MDDIIEQINNWQYPSSLPDKVEEFLLIKQIKADESSIEIFSYAAEHLKKKLLFYYNVKTKDYMLKRQFGFNEYNDINFINPSLEKMQQLLESNLEATLKEFLLPLSPDKSFILKEKGIYHWNYKDVLPAAIEDFELYIMPDKPVKLINGAYIVIDYSDFSKQKQFLIYYNELTDSFYAELKNKGIVSTTSAFDSRQIKDLEKLLIEKLKYSLKNF